MALTTIMTLGSGIEITNGYSIISSCLCKYIDPKSVEILLNVYKDKAAFDAKKPEVIQLKYKVSALDYDTYFDEVALEEDNTTILKQAYLWLALKDMHNEYVEV